MKINGIEIVPIAAESMGVRSLCTRIATPDLTLLLDPSAALSMRYRLEPHPKEYHALESKLQQIFVEARRADFISLSHYHYDHIRPGFTDFRYIFSSREELQRMLEGKVIFAKDNRDHINSSQRRRAYYFQKDLDGIAKEIKWVDGKRIEHQNTIIEFSEALPHGPDNTPLGFVIATHIRYENTSVFFAPDVQGPCSDTTLQYLLSLSPSVLIIGGPPTYISKFGEVHRRLAKKSLSTLVKGIPFLIIDHHLVRDQNWRAWLDPIRSASEDVGHKVFTMAEFLGKENRCLESERKDLYENYPPSDDFWNWCNATEEYKKEHRPPI
ncbi:MAG: hypothetical protein BAJATHORv1_10353 [Candidatus Thorarchaeota archaeon]|nr:MAG: hypothetical protein BAJATHORv1_10353 [Candidatus Thorarchaeota archaeon]